MRKAPRTGRRGWAYHMRGTRLMRHSSALRHLWIFGLAGSVWGGAVLAIAQGGAPSTRQAAARVDYEKQIRPVLEASCSECHSQDKRKGGLSLATYGDILEGGRNGAVVQARQQRRQPADPPRHRRDRAADAEGRAAARRRADRPHPPLDRSGRARHADVGGGPCSVGGAARARASSFPCRCAGRPGPRRPDRFVASYLAERKVAGASACVRCGLRAPRLPRRLGAAAIARRAAGVPGRSQPEQASRARRALACRQPEVRRPLDLVLERPAPQRRRRDVFFGDGRAQEHHRLAPSIARLEPPVRRVRHAPDQSSAADGSRRISRWRELARRNERRGHAVDAGVAEHGPGVSRRQLEVQRLPRQLRQQMEAEGRLLARRLLFSRTPGCGFTAAMSRRMPTPSLVSCIPS